MFACIVLLIHLLINPAWANLTQAIRSGDVLLVNRILNSGNNYGLYGSMQSYIDAAIDSKKWGILRSIYDYKQLHENFFYACANGNVELLDQLLQDPHISVKEGKNQCLISAIANDHINVVEILLNDGRTQLEDGQERKESQSRVLHALVEYNRPEIMALLLNKLEPQNYHNWAIITAAENGRYELVDLLIRHPLVNPGDSNNLALRKAVLGGHTQVVRRLLQSPSVNPSARSIISSLGLRIVGTDEFGSMTPLEIAAAKGYDEIADILLSDPRVNPADRNNKALLLASRNNHVDIVKKLLQNDAVLTKGSLTHILSASNNDHITQLLLEAQSNRKKIGI
jgi:ankyrin repeat protein